MKKTQAANLLASLPDSVRQSLKDKNHTIKYSRGAQILRQEEDSRDIFYFNYGTKLITFYTEKGDKLSFTEMSAGNSFGELSAIDSQPRSANILALEETSLTRIGHQQFQALLKLYPEFTHYVMCQMTAMIRRLHNRVYELSALDGTHRIYAELLRLAENGQQENGRIIVHNPPTHTEIAARVNSHREAVSRTCCALMKDGLLDKGPRQLIIIEPDVLRQRIDLCLKSQ